VKKQLFLVAALLVMLVSFILPTTVFAQDFSPVVSDGAGILSDSEENKIRDRANALSEQLGADVHIVTVNSIGSSANLDTYVANVIIPATPSWLAPDGKSPKSSLLVFAVLAYKGADGKMTGDMGIYFGDTWKPAFAKSSEMDILNKYMFPKFGTGDYVGAFIDSLGQAERVLDNYLNPPPPVDLSWLGTVLLWMLGTGVVVAAIVFIAKYRQQRKDEEEKRSDARLKAIASQNACMDILSKIDTQPFKDALYARLEKYAKLDPSRKSELTGLYDEFNSHYDQATSAIETATSTESKPSDKNLSIGTYQAMQRAFDQALTHAKCASSSAQKLETICGSIDRQVADLEKTIPEAKQTAESFKKKLTEAEKTFSKLEANFAESSWKSISYNGSEATILVEEAKKHLEEAEKAHAESKFGPAIKHAQEADQKLKGASSLISAIYERESHLSKCKADAPNEFKLAQADIDKAKKFYESRKGELDDMDYKAMIKDAESDLAIAKAEFDKPLPDYDLVIDKALEANHDADAILAECQNEIEREATIRRNATTTLNQARSTIDEASNYIRNHSADVGQTARNQLKRAEREYTEASANGTDVSNLSVAQHMLSHASKALELADDALKSAQSDVSDAEAARAAERRRKREAEEAREAEERRRRQRESNNDLLTGMVIGSAMSSHHSSSRSSGSSSHSSGGFSSSGFGGSSRSFGSSGSIGGSSRKW